MADLWSVLEQQAQAALTNNPFFSGGAVLMVIGALLAWSRKLPLLFWHWFLYAFTIVVDVRSDDPSYPWLLLWLDRHAYGHKARRITVKHIPSADDPGYPVSKTSLDDVKLQVVPARGKHWFIHKRRIVWLERNRENGPGRTEATDNLGAMLDREQITMRVLGRDRAFVLSIFEEAKALVTQEREFALDLHYFRYSYWFSQKKRNPRQLSSIILPPATMAMLEPDMAWFLKNQVWYRERGIPYRRGYLFQGPPGTGKSSVTEALAAHFRLPLYQLNLGICKNDSELSEAFGKVATQSILLIEDVDTAMPSRSKDERKQGISLGTLLNGLDGVAAVDGCIVILTTNHPEKLDPALIRAGRVDQTVIFDYADEQQIREAVRRFLPNSNADDVIKALPDKATMADVQKYLIKNVAHPNYSLENSLPTWQTVM